MSALSSITRARREEGDRGFTLKSSGILSSLERAPPKGDPAAALPSAWYDGGACA